VKDQTIRGVIPVAHTPFGDDDEIDYPSLSRQIDWAYEQGADGCCTGMVSELLRLTPDERIRLTGELAAMHEGRGFFVASVGAESTKQAVAYARHASECDCAGVMAIPPLSSAVSGEELIDYFSAIAGAIELPVIVQDASGYVGQAIPMSVYMELLDRFGSERILFKPESSPVGPAISELRDATKAKARVFDGSGGNLLIDAHRRGVSGTIPGMEFLGGVIAIWKALQDGDEQRAYQVYFPLCALVTLQLQAGLDGFLAVEKYILHKRGIFATDHRRCPNSWSLDRETQAEIDRLVQMLDEAVGA
jgi:2-keto-3-deoxy-L-arabinonate dehydratase